MNLKPSLAIRGCLVFFTSLQGFMTWRTWRASHERSSGELPKLSGWIGLRAGCALATMTFGSTKVESTGSR
ncbi:hypothetical protein D3C87_2069620 [compost metagenome]